MRIYLAYFVLILLAAALWLRMQRSAGRSHATLLRFGFGALAIAMGLLLGLATEPPNRDLFVDFTKAYYPAGQAAIANPAALYARSDDDLTFVNVPIVAWLFAPFAVFNLPTATVLMTLAGIVATIAACVACIRFTQATGWRQAAIVGAFAINGPLFYNLRMANTTQYTLLLLLGTLLCLQRKKDGWAGVLLAIAGVIKVPLLLLGIYYGLRQRWRVLAGFGGGLLAIGLASLLVFGLDTHLTWYQQCIQPFAGKPISAFNVQSLDGFLARSVLNGGLKNWLPMSVGWGYKLLRYVGLALLVGGALWVCGRSRPPATPQAETTEFAITLCLALLISPISWTHYYLLLLLPLALYLGDRLLVPVRDPWWRWMLLSGLLISLPVVNLNFGNPVIQLLLSKLLISHYFLGGVLLLSVLLLSVLSLARQPSVQSVQSVQSEAGRSTATEFTLDSPKRRQIGR